MSYRHNKKFVVIILAAGESKAPIDIRCVFLFCGRRMAKINREISVTLEDNKGIHWADLPDDVTCFEHKCRGCDYYYKIYTPETEKAVIELNTAIGYNPNVRPAAA